MFIAMTEADWKIFRKLREVALERFCQRVLDETSQTVVDPGKTCYERYQTLYALMERRDRELAIMFDNPRRSTALHQLLAIQAHRLLTEEEMKPFSPDVREAVQELCETSGE